MADLNFAVLCSAVEKWRYTPAGEGQQYRNFWVLTKITNDQVQYGDQKVIIEEQKLFLSIQISETESHRKALHAAMEILERDGAYFIATDARIGSYFNRTKNQDVFKLSVSLSNFRVFSEPRHPENVVVLCGKVSSVNSGWLQVEERYRNPKGEGEDAWRSRKVWVYTGTQMNIPLNQQIYVRGRLATKTPDGHELLYVIAEKIT